MPVAARFLLILACTGCLLAADPAATALDEIRAAARARTAQAKAEADWRDERDRLMALVAASEVETARLRDETLVARQAAETVRRRVEALGGSDDLNAIRTELSAAGVRLRAALVALAATMPPGAVAVPGEEAVEAGFDAAVRAIEASERAAGQVAVEVVTGRLGGEMRAVKLLRVAGAAAWWVALDGGSAGVIRFQDGAVELVAAQDQPTRAAIMRVLSIAEGRQPSAVVMLPLEGSP